MIKKSSNIYLPGIFILLVLIALFGAIYFEKVNNEKNNKTIKLKLNTKVSKNLPWKFSAETKNLDVKIGQVYKIDFNVENYGFNKTSGKAVYKVNPIFFREYFNEIDCFCYKKQTLSAGEKASYSITFYIDTEVLNHPRVNNIQNISISYTFLNNENG